MLRRIDENNELKNDRFTPTWEEVREHVLLLVCHMYKRDPKWQMKNEVTHGHEPPTPQVTPIGQTFDIQRTTVAELEFEGKLSYRFRDSEPRMIASRKPSLMQMVQLQRSSLAETDWETTSAFTPRLRSSGDSTDSSSPFRVWYRRFTTSSRCVRLEREEEKNRMQEQELRRTTACFASS